MRRNAIVEVGGSLLIAVLTGIYTILGFAGYYILGFLPSTKTFGIILLLVGVVSLPICVIWCVQLAREIMMLAPSGTPPGRERSSLP
jgi:hypothetical protein